MNGVGGQEDQRRVAAVMNRQKGSCQLSTGSWRELAVLSYAICATMASSLLDFRHGQRDKKTHDGVL